MNLPFSFRPCLWDTLKNYSAQNFYSDSPAGVTVGIVALPLSMALAIASGLPPQIGLFTAVIAGLCISAFGRFARANRRSGGCVRAAAGAHRHEARPRGARRLRVDG